MKVDRFFAGVKQDAVLWLVLVCLLASFRLFLLVHFRERIDASSGWFDVASVLLFGTGVAGLVARRRRTG